jgi:archaellum component FlaC
MINTVQTFDDMLTRGETVTAAVGTLAISLAERGADVAAARATVDADVERLTGVRQDLETVTAATAGILAEQSGHITEQVDDLVDRIEALREATAARFKEIAGQFELLSANLESAKETLTAKYHDALEAQAQVVSSLHDATSTVSTQAQGLADSLTEHAMPAIQQAEDDMGSAHETALQDWETERSQEVEHGVSTLSGAIDTVRDNTSRLLQDQRVHVGEASEAALNHLKDSMQNSIEQLKRRASDIERTIERVEQLATTTAKTTSESMMLLDDSSKSVGIGMQAALGCLYEMKRILERGR